MRWCLKSPGSQLFVQPFVQEQIKENIKALRHWPLWEESTSDGWLPSQRPVTRNMFPFGDVIMKTFIIPPPNEVGGGVYWIHLVRLSVCPSVRLSVCRRYGFRSISQVCFGISISNFICMLMVAIGRSLLIFSDVAFKMAAWRPYWIFWFPDSNFSLALNINFKLQWHNTYVYG